MAARELVETRDGKCLALNTPVPEQSDIGCAIGALLACVLEQRETGILVPRVREHESYYQAELERTNALSQRTSAWS